MKLLQVGYAHANWIYADKILKNIDSFDETSAYPYVMVTHKFPSTKFKRINITKFEELKSFFAYLIKVKFKNIKSKYFNNIISLSKCKSIYKGRYDNGRVIGAEELEIIVTDVDLRLIFLAYKFDEYEFEEVYFSVYNYLPKDFINFILEKYVEVEYSIEKSKFNSLYGMSVTNNIKDEVIFDNELGWEEKPISNDEILRLLKKEEKMGFLSYSYGVWVTAWARYNLLINLLKYDEFIVYSDTDSIKLKEGYDKKIIEEYNKSVQKKIKAVSKDLEIPLNQFMPKDIFGEKHILGVFEYEGRYEEFVTQGAKKYAYTKWVKNVKIKKDSNIIKRGKEISLVLEITVSGVPKKGAKGLKNLNEFKDNFIFDFKDTGKNIIIYNEEMPEFSVQDYQGNFEILKNKYGAVLVPTTYELSKSEDYMYLITDDSSKRAIFEEVEKNE